MAPLPVQPGPYNLKIPIHMNHKLRFDFSGNWYKGNTHTHSTGSDGERTVPELAAMYRAAGYDFLFITDHWRALEQGAGPQSDGFLLLSGMEINGIDSSGSDFHVVCLGDTTGLDTSLGFEAALRRARENGAVTVLAHPHWTGNSPQDARRHPFHAVEVYNHVCRWDNGQSSGLYHWDCMLARNPAVWGLAADDSHFPTRHPDWGGGWIWVNAPRLDETSVLDAIKKGNFYASQGPQILSLTLEDGTLSFESSPIQGARLAGPAHGYGEPIAILRPPGLTGSRFKIPEHWSYVRLELEDFERRCAWTNALMA